MNTYELNSISIFRYKRKRTFYKASYTKGVLDLHKICTFVKTYYEICSGKKKASYN